LGNGAGGHFAQFGNLGAAAEGVNNFGVCIHSAHLSMLNRKNATPLTKYCLVCLNEFS
jgi:hypothetical protein